MAPTARSPRQIWGDELALEAHKLAQRLDPKGMGVDARDLQDELLRSGFTIRGDDANRVVDSALNRAQHLFKRYMRGHWQWLPQGSTPDPSVGISGVTLAERAWTVAQGLDPARAGLHYHTLLGGLWRAGHTVKGPNEGSTLRKALDRATGRFDKVGRGVYLWRPA